MLGFLILAGIVGGVVVLARVIGAGPAPDTAIGVLEAAVRPANYSFETQAVRRSRPYSPEDGSAAPINEIHSLRAFAVDEAGGRFYGKVLHVLPETLTLASSSGTTMGRLGDGDWRALAEPISARAIRPPMADELLTAQPVEGDGWDTQSVGGQRVWVIDFTPTPKIIRSLLMSAPLKLTGKDQKEILGGDYETRWARAVVARDDRMVIRVDMLFALRSGPEYRILSNYTRINATRVDATRGEGNG